jgi:ADP-ribose diphosphatase
VSGQVKSNFSPTGFDQNDVVIRAVDDVYQGYAKVKTYSFTHSLFGGGTSDEITREIFVSGDAVMVIPYDVKLQSVLLIEQLRVAQLHRKDPPWIFEGVAGRIEIGEAPEEVARRESMEEAGCPLGALEEIGGFFPSPGIFAEHMTLYCAQANLEGAGGLYGLDDEAEDIRAVVVPLQQALEAIDSGLMVSAPTTLCLLWLDRNKARLTAAWQTDS